MARQPWQVIGCVRPEDQEKALEKRGCFCSKGADYDLVVSIMKGILKHSCKEVPPDKCGKDRRLKCANCGHEGLLVYLACTEMSMLTDTLFCPKCKETILLNPKDPKGVVPVEEFKLTFHDEERAYD